MSASPLPKKGSFSKLFALSNQHKRTPSIKSKKHSPVQIIHLHQEPPNFFVKPQIPDPSISALKEENLQLSKKVSSLKQKIRILQSSQKIQISSFDPSEKKNLLETQEKCLQLIDSLFNSLNTIFLNSVKKVKFEDFELKLINDFQNFQRKTRINTSEYVKKVLGWRHQFNDELLSPADSLNAEGKMKKKVMRSVSSIIASSIKVYGVCLKDFCADGKNGIWFKKGEIVEVVNMQNGKCEGRIGDRRAVFSEEFVKIV